MASITAPTAPTARAALRGVVSTRESLVRDLSALGVGGHQVVLVHASMRQIGRVQGGAASVAGAIRDVLGPAGTVVVPTETADNSDGSRDHLARIEGMTPAEIERYRARMRPFDPAASASVGMGRIAEHVRTTPGAIRSTHPQSSFAALGPMAASLTSGHALDCHLGERSPLARLYDARAQILLLGVGYEACTAFHLAEYRYPASPRMRTYNCVVLRDGGPRWVRYQDVVLDDSDFGALGAGFDAAHPVARGPVGQADCRLIPMISAVDFAVTWLRSHRQ
jgi:aminoglycoside 3-N-acetyltransferase